ncbi:hypothetical protein B9G39_07440 [Zooshikella ganghwensis]|uniref:Uncharacterized protein n=1 Tax=Zooshikella ganghwensis TaxID=202772 RepID=A0A4P9VJ58_9GAMM|nr:hypothetical protein B9G39_07440 [Zooshikella ganghwensis]
MSPLRNKTVTVHNLLPIRLSADPLYTKTTAKLLAKNKQHNIPDERFGRGTQAEHMFVQVPAL